MRNVSATMGVMMAAGALIDPTAFIGEIEVPPSRRRFVRQKIKRSGYYVAGGSHANVKASSVRNPKIAAQMNAMHERWFNGRFAEEITITAG